MQQNYKNSIGTFSSSSWQGRQNMKPGTAVGGNGHITVFTPYNKFQCSALSDFAPPKPKDKTSRDYFKAVIQISLEDDNVSHKKFANKKTVFKTSLMKTFYL